MVGFGKGKHLEYCHGCIMISVERTKKKNSYLSLIIDEKCTNEVHVLLVKRAYVYGTRRT